MKKRVIILLLSMAVTSALLAGCGTEKNSANTETAQVSDSQKNDTDQTPAVMGQVKSIDGSTITLTVGNPGGSGEPGGNMEKPPSDPGSDMGKPPAVSGNDMSQPPDVSGNGMGELPAAPENDMGQPPAISGNGMGEPPATPQNDMGQPPAMPGGDTDQPSAAEEREITVTDNTTYTLEEKQESKKGALSDIAEGSHIEVTLEKDGNTAASIVIRPDGPEGGNDTAEDIKLSGAETIDGEKATSSDESFSSSDADENAVLVTNKGNLHMAGASLSKSGDTSSEEHSNFYGQNAVLAVTSGSTAELTNVEITSDGEGANAIFATGENTSVLVDTAKIHTKGHSSRGLDATYGGTITASNVDISTEGAHCAALATDRGEGAIEVTGANLSTKGEGSPCIYSTGQITVRDASGNASGAQTLVVEGKNSVDLANCELEGAGDNGLMLYQSTSGDAQAGTAVLSASGSKLTTTSNGPMIYVTNTDAKVTLTDTKLKFPGDTLINVSGNATNNWGIPGQNGGNLTLAGIHQKLKGKVSCDAISTVRLVLSEGSAFTGSLNPEHTGKTVSVQLDDSSTWNVTEDSYVTFLDNTLQNCSNIQSNGHTIYYDSAHPDNEWLKGQQLGLPGGGQLVPLA